MHSSAGKLTFSFERLPVAVERCFAVAYGEATIAYDGRGAWWLEAVTLSSPRQPTDEIVLPHASALYNEVGRRLDQYRGDDIAERINAALGAGDHMALFAEHLTVEPSRRMEPPHARKPRRLPSIAAWPRASALLRAPMPETH